MTESTSCIDDVMNDSLLECRACLQIINTENVLYNIFESWNPPWDGMESCIAEDLAKLANVEIHQMDRHSKVICEMCCQLLLSACNFTAVVRRTDQLLQERLPLGLQEPDKSWPKPIQICKSVNNSMHENPMNVEIKQEILSDNEYEESNGIFDTKDELCNLDIKVEPVEIEENMPSISHYEENLNGLQSQDDPLKTDVPHLTNGNCGEHIETKIKEEPLSEEEDIEAVLTDLPLECLLCAKTFNSVTGLKAHVISQHSYKSVKRKCDSSVSPEKNKCKYTCAICRRNFTTSTDLMVHETCHNKSVCYGCNESFDTFDQLTKHRRTCKAIASQEVKKLKTLDDVIRPQTQEQSNVLKCTLCEETFTDMYYMKIHQEIHHSMPIEQNDLEDETGIEVESLESIFTGKIK